ncbi:LysR family transcriptional regulator [Agrobacterium radiobacter]|uniref:LysR family transcriptional regulator n=1 Tax=Agrobacterium radiobacter TaxID=362 RepID=UPI003CE4F875
MATPFTWDDLQYFLAVARTGQLSSAARSLRTSHATVSRHIDRLEFSLKTKLFERNPRGYELTTVGRRLVDTVERIEAEAERLQSDISESGSLLRGVVRLSAPEGFSNFFFVERLKDFAITHPHIMVEMVTIQQIMALSRKEADVAVTLDPPKAGPYINEQIIDYTLHIYASRSYLASHPKITRREDLPDHFFIGYVQNLIFSPGLDYMRDVMPGLRPGFQSSSIFAQLTATLSGRGLCILPNFIAARFPDLQMVLAGEVELRRGYWLTSHHDLANVPRVRSLMDFILATARAHENLFILDRRTIA